MMALAAQTSILSTMIVALVIIAIVAWIIRGMIQKKKEVVHLSDVTVGARIALTPVIIQRIVKIRVAAAAVAGASTANIAET